MRVRGPYLYHEGMSTPRAAGKVYAHVGQPFSPAPYDLVIVGAGRMGSLLAHFALWARPELRVLLLDQGGLPNEEGASILAPGVWTALDLPAAWRDDAELTRALVLGEWPSEAGGLPPAGPHDTPAQVRGLLELRSAPVPEGEPITHLSAEQAAELALLADCAAFAAYRQDPRALTYSVGALTTRAAQSAIRQGADLMLNARAFPTAQGVTVERLTVTNTHQIVVHETVSLAARQVVIAAGAAGPALAEQHLGTVTHHAQVYQQYPRLNTASSDQSPIVRAHLAQTSLTLRPFAGGYTVLTPIHHRDPYGYQPTGGRLSGVPVGVRRETLQDLLLGMDALPALATEALEVGRSLSDVAGAWQALPAGGWPLYQPLTGQHGLLLGGEKADLVGAAVARRVALGLG